MQQASDLGRAIQVRRAELGLKRKDLASRAKLSYPYLSELENGAKVPSARALGQLAEALQLPVAELMALAVAVGPDGQREDPYSGADVTPPAALLTYEPGEAHMRPSRVRLGGAALSAAGGVRPTSEDRLADLVAMTVRAELRAWARTELPELVRSEVARALTDREGGDAL